MGRAWAFLLFGLAAFLFALGLLSENWPAIRGMDAEGDVISSFALFIPLVGGALVYLWRDWFERSTRRRRMLVALRAEVFEGLKVFHASFSEEAAVEMETTLVADMKAATGEEHSMPTGTVVMGNPVFDEARKEISTLPESVIPPLLDFYANSENFALALMAFTRGDYEKLSEGRREKAIRRFVVVGRNTRDSAWQAFCALDDWICADSGRTEMRHDVRDWVRKNAPEEFGRLRR